MSLSFDLDRDSLVRSNFSLLEMKMSPGTQAERESSGFCSGEELEDPDTDSSSRSLSDNESRDSRPLNTPSGSKRRYEDSNNNSKHLDNVKRVCNFDNRLSKKPSSSPFRPWSDSKDSRETSPKIEIQEEPLSLVKEKKRDEEMPLDFRKKSYPFKSEPKVSEDVKPSLVDSNLNFMSSLHPYSLLRTSQLLASHPIHQIRNPINMNNPLLSSPAPFKPLVVHKAPLVNSIPLIPPNLLIPTTLNPLMYSKPFVDSKLNTLSNHIKLEDDVRVRLEDELKKERLFRTEDRLQNGHAITIKQEPSEEIVTKSKDSTRTTSKQFSNKQTSEKSHKTESLNKVLKKHERLDDLKMLNANNDSMGSTCTNDSDETLSLNGDYKKKCSSSQNYNRNYKNMTRERRIEANARERTRVHTISAAFETLRKTVPAYSTNQKLSKLSVLRIACSYIMTLSRIAGHDYSQDESEPSIESCVEDVTKTIQLEGKVKKKTRDEDEE
uniref:Protein atonal homolog 8 n=1 Tax=Cacopsylla melanoneura TaxID=428564 RepID=A0A8D8T6P8_9HEMI